MPYVSVPKDLTKVKTKFVLNLTLRQVVCFGTAALIGIPLYLNTREAIGNSPAMLLMIGVMFPAFFLAMYEKNGLPAEKIALNILRWNIFSKIRTYQTANYYAVIEKIGKEGAKADDADKTKVTKTQQAAKNNEK